MLQSSGDPLTVPYDWDRVDGVSSSGGFSPAPPASPVARLPRAALSRPQSPFVGSGASTGAAAAPTVTTDFNLEASSEQSGHNESESDGMPAAVAVAAAHAALPLDRPPARLSVLPPPHGAMRGADHSPQSSGSPRGPGQRRHARARSDDSLLQAFRRPLSPDEARWYLSSAAPPGPPGLPWAGGTILSAGVAAGDAGPADAGWPAPPGLGPAGAEPVVPPPLVPLSALGTHRRGRIRGRASGMPSEWSSSGLHKALHEARTYAPSPLAAMYYPDPMAEEPWPGGSIQG